MLVESGLDESIYLFVVDHSAAVQTVDGGGRSIFREHPEGREGSG
jgi:hypothetical protein